MSLKLIHTDPYISSKEVIDKQLFIPTMLLSDIDRQSGEDERFDGTIATPEANVTGSAIPIPNNYDMINIFMVRRELNKNYLTVNKNLGDMLRNEKPELITSIPDNSYLYMPPGISAPFSTSSGMDIFTNIQNRYDNMIECYRNWIENDKKYNKNLELRWLQCYNRLIGELTSMLVGRGGLYEKAVGCQWKHSLRAVAIPDPSLELNEIEIPTHVIISWLQDINFRKAYDIDENMPIRDAIRFMNGKRIIVGRQPSHDKSNLLSFKLRVR